MSTRGLSDQINGHVRIATLQQLRKAGKLATIFTYSSPSNASSAIVLLEFSSLNQNTINSTDSLPGPNHHESDATVTHHHRLSIIMDYNMKHNHGLQTIPTTFSSTIPCRSE
jgi:hypothetical protein